MAFWITIIVCDLLTDKLTINKGEKWAQVGGGSYHLTCGKCYLVGPDSEEKKWKIDEGIHWDYKMEGWTSVIRTHPWTLKILESWVWWNL